MFAGVERQARKLKIEPMGTEDFRDV